jgi:hypothetical protein
LRQQAHPKPPTASYPWKLASFSTSLWELTISHVALYLNFLFECRRSVCKSATDGDRSFNAIVAQPKNNHWELYFDDDDDHHHHQQLANTQLVHLLTRFGLTRLEV